MNHATHFWHARRAGRTRPEGRVPEPTRPGTPPPRTAWRPTRRGLLRTLFASASVAFTGAALSRIIAAPRQGGAAGPGSAAPAVSGLGLAEGAVFDEMHAGHRVQGRVLGADAADVAVFVDGRQLMLMRRADGSYLSAVDHYDSYATAREAARAAAAELGRARLAAVPVHAGREGGAARGVHA
ncbi:tyrosinase family oxidase copper chaperone [Streptomyces sp. NBC_00083]|uniref:tyrosinase family oxidase copper chaperone n=1 Tax=Streptomyces sp. NBC_00083 TaxID=2975647 RepID=UPI00225A2F5B|nr:tyrosinase family oxidase copper chaperone [Streptomyces sp. NBC_00083]MCX5381776.1 tyrosinase cofactor [Streptomyces sp. NBC_00083]